MTNVFRALSIARGAIIGDFENSERKDIIWRINVTESGSF